MGKTRDLFKKIRDTKGIFHAKMHTIKDRNGMVLREAQDIKMRWQEYTEKWKWKSLCHIWLCDPMDCPWNSPGQSTGVGCHCLLREEISRLSHSIVFLYFFALISEEGVLISPCYSLELCIQMGISFLFSFAFLFLGDGLAPCLLNSVMNHRP